MLVRYFFFLTGKESAGIFGRQKNLSRSGVIRLSRHYTELALPIHEMATHEKVDVGAMWAI